MMPRTISKDNQHPNTSEPDFSHTVDIAETTCFTLFGVMKTSSPVDGDIAFAPVEASCALHTATSADAAEIKQPVEDWTVITNIVFSLLLGEVVHVVRSDLLEEINILIRVELGHFMASSWFCALGEISQ